MENFIFGKYGLGAVQFFITGLGVVLFWIVKEMKKDVETLTKDMKCIRHEFDELKGEHNIRRKCK